MLISALQKVADEIVNCYAHDGKVLFCGNGGSAADAQHIAAELSGRFTSTVIHWMQKLCM